MQRRPGRTFSDSALAPRIGGLRHAVNVVLQRTSICPPHCPIVGKPMSLTSSK